jgi:hypothetical protein
MASISTTDIDMPRPLRRIYQCTSIIWTAYATALTLAIYGSTLLAFAQPARGVLATLTMLVGIGMLVRAIVPGRPEWTRWTLPLIGGTSVATFTLLLFASDFAGGFTAGRIGYSLLVLTPGGIAYVHYLGEKVVAPR